MKNPTELDHAVLGVIGRSGPMTTYSVRKVFEESGTTGWSSSSGSIYPSIRRLAESGLVRTAEPGDGRGTQLIRITSDGRRRLKTWIGELDSALGSATADPIRTRAQFLEIDDSKQLAKFIADARSVTCQALANLQRKAETGLDSGDPYRTVKHLGLRGAILELEARLAWLDELEAHCG